MGVFQLESDGMKRVCTELKPSRFDDIIALVALYRPGPMDWIPRLHRDQARPARSRNYLHPKLEPILAETYGDRLLPRASHADRARHRGLHDGRSRRTAQGHGQEAKRQDSRLPQRSSSRARSRRRGLDAQLAEEIFEFIEPFAGYGFNKSHAAAYGWIAYQTAFLKANHPLQYLSRADDVGQRQDRQTGRVHRRGEEARHRGAAARRQRVAGRFCGRRRSHPVRAGGGQRRRRGRGAQHHRRARERGTRLPTFSTWPSASTPSRSTAAFSKR